jgi:ParB-like chromosome segregation protein Spo0J
MHFTDDESFLARVTENLVRNTYVDPLEEAEGYRVLVEKGWTVNAIGRRVGKCDSYVSERLGLIERLSSSVRASVSKGLLTPSHAELLSRIANPAKRDEVAELAIRKRLSVRTLETIISGAPLPCEVKLKSIAGECYVKIPAEFMNTLRLTMDKPVFLYVKGSKLIIDSTECKRNSKKKSTLAKPNPTPLIESARRRQS